MIGKILISLALVFAVERVQGDGDSYATTPLPIMPRTIDTKTILPCNGPSEHVIPSGETVWLSSPRFFNNRNYPGRKNCKWTIKAESGSELAVECVNVKMQGGRGCRKDFFAINGERFCGWQQPPFMTGDTFDIQFKSNKRKNFKGFSCRIEASATTMPDTTTMAPDTTTTMPDTTTMAPDTTTMMPNTTTMAPNTTTAAPVGCRCGQRNGGTRIVGGVPAPVHGFPWQVGLVSGQNGSIWCGASLISDQWILTAAHCIDGETASGIKVRVGEHEQGTDSETTLTQFLPVEQIISHWNYDSTSMNNDVALLKLKTPLVFTDNSIAPICLPASDYVAYTGSSIVTGWGTTSYKGSVSNTLLQVTVPMATQAKCKQEYGTITDQMVCAGGESNGGKDSCQGDSGGPLIKEVSGQSYYEQIGVVSFGYKCAEPNVPGVYARVSEFIRWINKKTGGLNTCSPPA